MTEELHWLDATAQAELVRSGEVTPLELVDHAIARVEQLDPTINAFVSRRFEQARAEAAGDLPEGPFRGVPFGYKDLGAATAGDPHLSGMRYLKDLGWTEPADSPLAAKFKASGLVHLGRLATPELGAGVTTEPLAFGPTANPWEPGHMAGGSSGGSAAAVAAGMIPAAHASDGGGSIRIPASCCGLVGLKVSRGRVSGAAREDVEMGFGVHGVVTRSVRDTAGLLDAVHGSGPGDWFHVPAPTRPFAAEVGAPTGRLRIGVLTHTPAGGSATDPVCADAATKTAALLSELGHLVEDEYPTVMDDEVFTVAYSTFVAVGVSTWLELWAERTGVPAEIDVLEPGTQTLARFGEMLTAQDAMLSLHHLHRHRARLAAWWESGFDLLLTPTLPEPPLELGVAADAEDPGTALMRAAPFTAYTSQFNVSGQPAITLPLHESPDGLPVGVQLVAPFGREDLLLRVAAQLEEAAPWASRRPQVS